MFYVTALELRNPEPFVCGVYSTAESLYHAASLGAADVRRARPNESPTSVYFMVVYDAATAQASPFLVNVRKDKWLGADGTSAIVTPVSMAVQTDKSWRAPA